MTTATLTADEEQVMLFAEKFSSLYDDGHIILARHAAFPAAVTVDLLYQLWANFKSYKNEDGNIKIIPLLAVSDLLLSSLFRQTGKDIYEMTAATRSLLLNDLVKDKRFGETRIHQLASFLYQYIEAQPNRPEWKNFKEAQKWTALLAVDPEAATQDVLQALMDKVKKSQVNSSIGIVNMIEDFVKDNELFAEQVAKHLQETELDPLTTSTSAELTASKSIILDDKEWPNAVKLKVNIPAHLSQRLKTIKESQVKKKHPADEPAPEFIKSLIIGISDYKSPSMKLQSPVNDAQAFNSTLQSAFKERYSSKIFLNDQVVKENILNSLRELIRSAASNDHLLIYFGGHAVNTDDNPRLVLFDYPDTTETPRHLAPYCINMREFNGIILENSINDPFITLILDTHSGHEGWVDTNNPKHTLLMASHVNERVYETPDLGGVFTNALITSLNTAGNHVTYRELYKQVMRKVDEYCLQSNLMQTTLFRVHFDSWDTYFLSSKKQDLNETAFALLRNSGYGFSDPVKEIIARDIYEKKFLDDHGILSHDKLIHYLKLKIAVQKGNLANVLFISQSQGEATPGYEAVYFERLDIQSNYVAMPELDAESDSFKPESLKMVIDAHVLIIDINRQNMEPPFNRSALGKILSRGFAYEKDVVFLLKETVPGVAALQAEYRIIPASLYPTDTDPGIRQEKQEMEQYATLLKNLLTINKKEGAATSNPIALKIEEAKSTRKLDLSGSNLFKIIPEILELEELEELDLNSNNITNIPAEISRLKNLRVLNLSANPITELPGEIRSLKNLEKLSVSNTELSVLPDSIGELSNLNELYVHATKIVFLPDSLLSIGSMNIFDTRENNILNVPANILDNKRNAFTNLQTYLNSLAHLHHEEDVIISLITNSDLKVSSLKEMMENIRINNKVLLIEMFGITIVDWYAEVKKHASDHSIVYLEDIDGIIAKQFESVSEMQLASFFKSMFTDKKINLFFDGPLNEDVVSLITNETYVNSVIYIPIGSRPVPHLAYRFFENYFRSISYNESFENAVRELAEQGSEVYKIHRSENFEDHTIPPPLEDEENDSNAEEQAFGVKEPRKKRKAAAKKTSRGTTPLAELRITPPRAAFQKTREHIDSTFAESSPEELLIIDRSLIIFTAEVSEQDRDDIKRSFLYAQMAANYKQPEKANGMEWYDSFMMVFTDFGWAIQQSQWPSEKDAGESRSSARYILKNTVEKLGAEYAQLVSSGINAAESFTSKDPEGSNFEANTHTDNDGLLQVALILNVNDTLLIRMVTFYIHTSGVIEQILKVNPSPSQTEITTFTTYGKLNKKVYAKHRAAIAERVAIDVLLHTKRIPLQKPLSA